MKSNSFQSWRLLGVVFFFLALGFSAGFYLAIGRSLGLAAGSTATSTIDLRPLEKVWRIIDEEYYAGPTTTPQAISPETKLWGAIGGLVDSLGDPYSVFLPPEEKKQFEEDIRGNFGGVGIELELRDKALTVISSLVGTPAAQAGIQPGDRIIRINGQAIQGWSVVQAVRLIRGTIGTPVTLTVEREGSDRPLEFKLIRAEINIPILETKKLPDGIFLITLHNFTEQSPQLFRAALRGFIESGDQKLILDLRGNPGGYLGAAVDMGSWFLPAGKIIVIEDHRGTKSDRVYRSYGYDLFTNRSIKIIVLVDKGSASAAEILAGALAVHHVATLLGEPTFGKGTVQEIIHVTPEADLKLTVARWLLPDNKPLPADGLRPEILAPRTEMDIKNGLDPQLAKAIEILK